VTPVTSSQNVISENEKRGYGFGEWDLEVDRDVKMGKIVEANEFVLVPDFPFPLLEPTWAGRLTGCRLYAKFDEQFFGLEST
jgi:hypothetical protein